MHVKAEKYIAKKPVAALCACFCCLLWGSAFPMIKIGYSQLGIESADYMSQLLFAGVRFTLAGVFTVIAGGIISKSAVKISKKGLYKIPVLALFQTVLQYLFFYFGLAKTTGTKSSIIDSTSVFFSVLIACLVLKQERLGFKKALGCVLGFAGVVIINLSGDFGGASFAGEGFIVLSALSYAVSSVLIKQFSKTENPVALSGYQFILGGLVMTAAGFALGGRLNINGVKSAAVLIYLALLSACAYTIWGILLKYNPVSQITVFGFMTPVFGCILSAVMLGESASGGAVKTVAALILVCLGIYIVNKSDGGKPFDKKGA